MEPPPFGDGNERCGTWTWSPTLTFNGATALRRWKPGATWPVVESSAVLQWSHRPSAMETANKLRAAGPPFRTFNGATALRRWKPGGGTCWSRIGSNLQWSHRPSAMETVPGPVDPHCCGALQWSHRPSAMETVLNPLSPLVRSWRLQWSHRPSAMETRRRGQLRHPHHGPSMEPPPFGDGNLKLKRGWTPTTNLQWSHRPSAMETGCIPHGRCAGRAFNGATALRRWKLVRVRS